ncbi:MAG: hypothetical protein LUG89_01710 [Methanosphaera sp.]|nr:hypothetical protein [Methanosphaera sp.]
MSLLNKIKNKILNSSNSYNYYKTNYEKLLIEKNKNEEYIKSLELINQTNTDILKKVEQLINNLYEDKLENLQSINTINLDLSELKKKISAEKIDQINNNIQLNQKELIELEKIMNKQENKLDDVINNTNEIKSSCNKESHNNNVNIDLLNTILDEMKVQKDSLEDLISTVEKLDDKDMLNNIINDISRSTHTTSKQVINSFKNIDEIRYGIVFNDAIHDSNG